MSQEGLIYIISNVSQAKENLYRIGFYDRSSRQLLDKYSEILSEPIIFFSDLIPSKLADDVQVLIYYDLGEYLLDQEDKWLHTTLYNIIGIIQPHIQKAKRNNP